MKLTAEKIVGIKFEIWLGQYFKSMNCQEIKRNVEFHKEKNIYRQADLIFLEVSNKKILTTIVEAKYSSKNSIKYSFRQGVKEKYRSDGLGSTQLTNLVDEIIERQNFVKAYRSILVTNKFFDEKIVLEAQKNNIQLIDGEKLFHDYKLLGGKYNSLEKSILEIDITRYNLNKNIYQLR